MTRRVLFLCTGNYYRSRFAEAVFNHHAALEGLAWVAFSRGLASHMAEGDLSVYTASALRRRQIELSHTAPTRMPLCEEDLAEADLIIALKDAEHRPMVVRLFPEWEARIVFWDVSDVDAATPEEALPLIEQHVLDLLSALARDERTELPAEHAEGRGKSGTADERR
jgi:low molecular weight protein-tyrosine phosphatase